MMRARSGAFEPHARIVRRIEVGFVLQREREDRHAFRGEGVDRSERGRPRAPVELREAGARAPGCPRSFIQPGGLQGEATMRSSRIDRERRAQHRQQLRAVGLDGEMREVRIRLAVGRVVEAVVAARKIRRADRDARETQTESAIAAEQFLEERRPLRLVEPRLDEPCARVGDRCTKADDRLVAAFRVDIDPIRERRPRGERHPRFAREQAALIGRRHPGLHVDRGAHARQNPEQRAERQAEVWTRASREGGRHNDVAEYDATILAALQVDRAGHRLRGCRARRR